MLTRSRKKAGHNADEQTQNFIRIQSCSKISKETSSVQNDVEVVSKALENVLILDAITSFLPLSDLKQFRLVSRQWNQESLPAIRKRASAINIHFTGYNSTATRRLHLEEHWGVNTSKKYKGKFETVVIPSMNIKYANTLANLVKSSSAGFPVTKFELTTELLQYDQKLFSNILECVSSFATEIKLDVGYENLSIDMSTIQFPCLRALSMRQSNLRSVKIEGIMECFQHILHSAPLLDKFALESVNDLEIHTEDMLKAIDSSPICAKLRTLDLRTDLSDEHLLVLKEMDLRLHKFDIVFCTNPKFSPESFRLFLESQRESLENIRIENWENGSTREQFQLRLPSMLNLSVLNLQVDQVDLSELSFPRDLPVLKRLELGNRFGFINFFQDLVNDRKEPLETLETLKAPFFIHDCKSMSQVARMFPNLKRLECSIGEDTVTGTVTDGLSNLEELSLHTKETDYDLVTLNNFNIFMTGYSSSELQKIEKSWSTSGELRIDERKQPNVFLQRLKILQIIGGKFTDLHCLLGPMKLRSLQCFKLRIMSWQAEVSQRVLEQMREKFVVLVDDKCKYEEQLSEKPTLC